MTQKEFTKLVQQYEKLIYTVCYQFTQDHFAAQDLTQETFLAAYRRIDTCDPQHYRPWLSRIAANKAKDYLKSAQTRREMPCGELPLEPAIPGPELRIFEKVGSDEIRQRIWSLREPYREPAVLFFLEELPPGEISRRLNRPEKTIYTQLNRAKKMLQRSLKGGAP